MGKADEMRLLADQFNLGKKATEDRSLEEKRNKEIQEDREVREWFKSEGRDRYLAEIAAAAAAGHRKLTLYVASSTYGDGMTFRNRKKLELVREMLNEEGFFFRSSCESYDRTSQGEGLPNERGNDYCFEVTW